MYPLTTIQRARLDHLAEILAQENHTEETIDPAFHEAVKALFCWQEPRRLIDEMACPVQRFLVCSSIEKSGKGFINAKEVGRLIAKLMYNIRACVYLELIRRSKKGWNEIGMDKELGGLRVYLRDMEQTPFGFLNETMHLAAAIAGELNALPQIC